MITADKQYFAELCDNEDNDAVPYDNQVIEASNDEDAIGKANKWAASRKLGVVATLSVKDGARDVYSRKVYLGLRPDDIWSNPDMPSTLDLEGLRDLPQQREPIL